MGCDIHYVIEKKFDDRWIGIMEKMPSVPAGSLYDHTRNAIEYKGGGYVYPLLGGRNYQWFASLAGVRSDDENNPQPKDEPNDVSELAHVLIEHDGEDGHSHSYDTLRDFVIKWLLSQEDEGSNAQKLMLDKINDGKFLVSEIHRLTGIEEYENGGDPDYKNYRVVYWFDN